VNNKKLINNNNKFEKRGSKAGGREKKEERERERERETVRHHSP